MKICNLALLLLINTCFVKTSHAGTNDIIFNSSFEPVFFVGGTTTTSNVVLKLNHYDDYTISSIGTYVIPYPIENGSNYLVEVVASPAGSLCTVQNNSGTITDDNIINADVFCGLLSTLYDIKQEIATGVVSIENVIVTECKDDFGFWIQTIAGDADYSGDDYSGAFVYKSDMVCSGNSADVHIGDRISLIPALVNEFFGQILLINSSITILSSNNSLPLPVITSVANLAGVSAVPLEGVLVMVHNLVVTDVQTPPGFGEPSPSNTFEVNNQLLVDDILYLTQPFPQIMNAYDSITGISIFRNSLSKLLPRYSQDVFLNTGSGIDLVINEVDYNQPGPDENEYIEIFNPTNSTISLSNINLYLINGFNNTDYAQIDLTGLGSLLPGQYLVIGSSNMIADVAIGALTLEFAGPTNQMQNGNPEGLVLFDKNSNMVIDSLSYGGDITTATLTDINMVVNVVEGSGSVPDTNGIDGSIARFPNGDDTDDNSQDWNFTISKTPGAYNTFTTTPELLVINEFDYDTPNSDDMEFIEIYNPSLSDISLTDVSLYLINGANNTDYSQIELDSLGTIQAGQYLVIGSSNMINSVAQGALRLEFENPTGQIQNGGPDGMVLFDKNSNSVIDSLSYEGNITMATLSDVGIVVTVTEGNATVEDGNSPDASIARLPNGEDTDINADDFSLTETLTPGEANIN